VWGRKRREGGTAISLRGSGRAGGDRDLVGGIFFLEDGLRCACLDWILSIATERRLGWGERTDVDCLIMYMDSQDFLFFYQVCSFISGRDAHIVRSAVQYLIRQKDSHEVRTSCCWISRRGRATAAGCPSLSSCASGAPCRTSPSPTSPASRACQSKSSQATSTL
jgi:hypothetical protein